MKGRTKKERRAIGKAIRWIRKMRKRGFDYFGYNKYLHSIYSFKTNTVPGIGKLSPLPLTLEHDDMVTAFATFAYSKMFERKDKAFALPLINDIEQIITIRPNED